MGEDKRVSHLHYIGVLLFIGGCGVGVNRFFKTGFTARWRIFLLTDLLVLILYTAWDSWAIYKRNWYFDRNQILGLHVLFSIPIEEILFFIVVPFTTIATFLALKKLTGWESDRK
jgi:lycopene cyclase domain-containing protein